MEIALYQKELELMMIGMSGCDIMNPDYLTNRVCDILKLDKTVLLGKSKLSDYTEARFILFKILRQNTKLSLKQIAAVYNMDHSTVIYGLTEFDNLVFSKYQPLLDKLKKVNECLSIPNLYN
ncbi:MAG: hypothetical protein IE931_03495 [Sphingobacteriales bacterium]|nr:hypothetical protein [Sphingobacteriales bacterium]